MRLRFRKSRFKQGVAIVVVIIMIVLSIIMGMGLHLYSLSTRFQVARASYSTAAEYICEAVCEEGFFLAQKSFNSPDFKINDVDGSSLSVYDRVRSPEDGAFTVNFKPSRVIKHLQRAAYDEMSVNFPAEGIKGSITVVFDRPFSDLPNQSHEYSGSIITEASVIPMWTSGMTAFRKMIVTRKFKVIAITPPALFDESALTIINPDYINGASKANMDEKIFKPVNEGIDAHNNLCRIYRKLCDFANDTCASKCSGCQGASYVGGSPKLITPKIQSETKIPADFFDDKSLIFTKTEQDKYDKLIDFNYEDILFEIFPPLYNFFKSVLSLSQLNAAVLTVTTALLAIVPGHEICDALDATVYGAAIAEILRAIHSALEAIVPIQFLIGQITLIVQKIVMEGHIVGQLFENLNEASRGNFMPAAGGAATFVGDLNASGAFEDVDSTTEGIQGVGGEASQQDFTQGVVNEGEDGTFSIDEEALNAEADKYGSADKFEDGAFDGKFDSLTSLEGKDQSIRSAGSSLTALFGGSTDNMGAFTEMASDSNLAALTGLIKGFVKCHRNLNLIESVPGEASYEKMRMFYQAYDKELWKAKATFITTDNDQLKKIFEKYKDVGLCGIICHTGSDTIKLSLDKFKGKLIIFSESSIDVEKCTLNDKKTDSVTIISNGTIDLKSAKIEASLNATGNKNSAILFGSNQNVFGNILLDTYSVASQDDRESNRTAIKGKLVQNHRLQQTDYSTGGIKPSHLRVIISPLVYSQEVKMR